MLSVRALVKIVDDEAIIKLDEKRKARIKQLYEECFKPSSGWLNEPLEPSNAPRPS
jgi:hypothetical protein